jgi:phenol 2-monooxygenase
MHMAAFYNPAPDGSGIELSERLPDVTAPTARYPFKVTLHQGAIEDIFRDAMRELGRGMSSKINGACGQKFEKHPYVNGHAAVSWPPRSIEVEQPIIPTSISISKNPAELASRDSYPVTVHLKRLTPSEARRLSQTIVGGSPTSNGATVNGNGAEAEHGEEEIVRAKYVVGCDGAHSWTRNQMGWKMEGEHTGTCD